jgi:hypothetical protein
MPTPKKPSLVDMDKSAENVIENKDEKIETKEEKPKAEENKEIQEPTPEAKPVKKTKPPTKPKAKKTTKKAPVKQQAVEVPNIEEEKSGKKKVGRKASRPGCTEKIYFTTTPETKERIQIAVLQEKIQETKKGNSLFDQSSFLEKAVLDYLKRKKY